MVMATMTDTQYYFLCFILSFISIFLLKPLFKKPSKTKTSLDLPPSPPALPIIGHLHYLGPSLYKSLTKLSTKYGPLLYLKLGVSRCLVVSSASMANEIFKIHDLAFAERPSFPFSVLNISNGMCYTMLCMLEWMRKRKHRIGTLWTRGLRGSALTAYIHGGIP